MLLSLALRASFASLSQRPGQGQRAALAPAQADPADLLNRAAAFTAHTVALMHGLQEKRIPHGETQQPYPRAAIKREAHSPFTAQLLIRFVSQRPQQHD